MTAPTPNAELAYRVLDHIDANPEQWRQGEWIGEAECGTVGCFAGWAVLLSGGRLAGDGSGLVTGLGELDGTHVWQAADALLGIGYDYLNKRELPDPYDGLRNRESLGETVAEIFGPRPEPKRCPHCDAAVPEGMQFPTCTGCGRVLTAALLADDVPPNAGSAS